MVAGWVVSGRALGGGRWRWRCQRCRCTFGRSPGHSSPSTPATARAQPLGRRGSWPAVARRQWGYTRPAMSACSAAASTRRLTVDRPQGNSVYRSANRSMHNWTRSDRSNGIARAELAVLGCQRSWRACSTVRLSWWVTPWAAWRRRYPHSHGSCWGMRRRCRSQSSQLVCRCASSPARRPSRPASRQMNRAWKSWGGRQRRTRLQQAFELPVGQHILVGVPRGQRLSVPLGPARIVRTIVRHAIERTSPTTENVVHSPTTLPKPSYTCQKPPAECRGYILHWRKY